MKYIYFNDQNELNPYQLEDQWRTDQIAIAQINLDKEEDKRTIQLLNQAYNHYGGTLDEIGIVVVSHPDYRGGRQNKWYFLHEFPYPVSEDRIEFPSVFEYVAWAGTLEQFIIENPVFEDHWEPNKADGTERREEYPSAHEWLKEKLSTI